MENKKFKCLITNVENILLDLTKAKKISGDLGKIFDNPLIHKWKKKGILVSNKKDDIDFAKKNNIPINKIIDIDWDIGYINCYTDGSCIFNGKKNAKAGWAFLAENIIHYGSVPPFEFGNNCEITPSNNRGELLAIIKCLMFAEKNGFIVCLITDSKYCILIIEKLKKNETYFNKNQDLIDVLRNYVFLIDDVIWQKSHTKIESDHRKYNEVVDSYAKKGIEAEKDEIVVL